MARPMENPQDEERLVQRMGLVPAPMCAVCGRPASGPPCTEGSPAAWCHGRSFCAEHTCEVHAHCAGCDVVVTMRDGAPCGLCGDAFCLPCYGRPDAEDDGCARCVASGGAPAHNPQDEERLATRGATAGPTMVLVVARNRSGRVLAQVEAPEVVLASDGSVVVGGEAWPEAPHWLPDARLDPARRRTAGWTVRGGRAVRVDVQGVDGHGVRLTGPGLLHRRGRTTDVGTSVVLKRERDVPTVRVQPVPEPGRTPRGRVAQPPYAWNAWLSKEGVWRTLTSPGSWVHAPRLSVVPAAWPGVTCCRCDEPNADQSGCTCTGCGRTYCRLCYGPGIGRTGDASRCGRCSRVRANPQDEERLARRMGAATEPMHVQFVDDDSRVAASFTADRVALATRPGADTDFLEFSGPGVPAQHARLQLVRSGWILRTGPQDRHARSLVEVTLSAAPLGSWTAKAEAIEGRDATGKPMTIPGARFVLDVARTPGPGGDRAFRWRVVSLSGKYALAATKDALPTVDAPRLPWRIETPDGPVSSDELPGGVLEFVRARRGQSNPQDEERLADRTATERCRHCGRSITHDGVAWLDSLNEHVCDHGERRFCALGGRDRFLHEPNPQDEERLARRSTAAGLEAHLLRRDLPLHEWLAGLPSPQARVAAAARVADEAVRRAMRYCVQGGCGLDPDGPGCPTWGHGRWKDIVTTAWDWATTPDRHHGRARASRALDLAVHERSLPGRREDWPMELAQATWDADALEEDPLPRCTRVMREAFRRWTTETTLDMAAQGVHDWARQSESRRRARERSLGAARLRGRENPQDEERLARRSAGEPLVPSRALLRLFRAELSNEADMRREAARRGEEDDVPPTMLGSALDSVQQGYDPGHGDDMDAVAAELVRWIAAHGEDTKVADLVDVRRMDANPQDEERLAGRRASREGDRLAQWVRARLDQLRPPPGLRAVVVPPWEDVKDVLLAVTTPRHVRGFSFWPQGVNVAFAWATAKPDFDDREWREAAAGHALAVANADGTVTVGIQATSAMTAAGERRDMTAYRASADPRDAWPTILSEGYVGVGLLGAPVVLHRDQDHLVAGGEGPDEAIYGQNFAYSLRLDGVRAWAAVQAPDRIVVPAEEAASFARSGPARSMPRWW